MQHSISDVSWSDCTAAYETCCGEISLGCVRVFHNTGKESDINIGLEESKWPAALQVPQSTLSPQIETQSTLSPQIETQSTLSPQD